MSDDQPTFEKFASQRGGAMPTASDRHRKARSKKTARSEQKSKAIGRAQNSISKRRLRSH